MLKLSPAVADAIVSAVRRGVPPGTVARAMGISQPTLIDWLEAPVTGRWRSGANVDDETLLVLSELRERVEQAQAEYETELITSISEASKVTGRSGVPEWRAAAWIANNHPALRKRYKQERSLSVDNDMGTVRHEHTHKLIREVPSDQLQRLFEALPPGGDR